MSIKDAFGDIFGKPEAPAAPDYAGAAREQGNANVNLSVAENRLNNPNVITPYGGRNVTWGTPDQQQGGGQHSTGDPHHTEKSNYYNNTGGGFNTGGGYNTGGGIGPNGEINYNDVPQATITEYLSPNQQAILEGNENLQMGLLETGGNQLERVDDAMSTPWDTSGAPKVDAYDPSAISKPSYLGRNNLEDFGRYSQEGLQDFGRYSQEGLQDFGRYDQDALGDVRDLNTEGMSGVDEATIGGQDRIVEALMARYMPDIDKRRQQASDNLLTQGHTRGGTAWDTQQRASDQTENDFRMATVLNAGQEQDRLLGNQRANRGQEWGERMGMSDFDMARQNQQWGQQQDMVNNQNNIRGAQWGEQQNMVNNQNNIRGAQWGEQAAIADQQNAIRGQQWGEKQGVFDANMARTAMEANLEQNAQAATTADRGRYINEQAYDRNVPLNEANALRTGNQVQPYNYQAYQPTQIQNAPLFDATLAQGNFGQQNYATQSQLYGDMWQGAGQAGAAAVASDRRLKEDIKPVQEINGLMTYLFKYKGKAQQYIGFMADEVKKLYPNDVINIDGYDHVTARFAPMEV